jgi:predicted ATPase
MEFLKLMRRMNNSGNCQIIMATHSPVLMAYPNARLLRLSKYGLEAVTVEQTDQRSCANSAPIRPGSWKR